MKKIAIDCRSISKHKTGVGNVLANTLKRLNLKNAEITLFFDRELEKEEKNEFEKLGYIIRVLKSSNYVLWEQIIFPIKIGNKFDYVWFPANTGSVFIRAKKIATIHDVIFAKKLSEIPLSKILSKDLARLYRRIFAYILAKTSVRVYTVSEFSKKDIIDRYKIKEDKVKVIYNGLDEIFINNDLNIKKEKYILSFGSNEPRKNTELMIKAYKKFLDNYPELSDYRLVLYGFRGYKKSPLKNLINELNINDNVVIYEYISDKELINLYKQAKVFCFLSSFEGFGLPIIESMACGTPVIALNNSSIPEIVNEAGILLESKEANEIAEEIRNLLINEETYSKYIDLGYENIKLFNWKKTVKNLEKDMEEIIQ